MHGQQNMQLLDALPMHRRTERASMGTVNLLLQTPRNLLPRFQLAICIHLDTVSDTPLGSALPVDYFTVRPQAVMNSTDLQATALLENTISKNKSNATLIGITTYSTGRQWDA